jgi:hypothetical protein
MAYKNKYSFGLEEKSYPEAYFLIKNLIYKLVDDEEMVENAEGNIITLYRTRKVCEVVVYIYGDEKARKNLVEPINHFIFNFTPDFDSQDNLIKQAYNKLKTLEDFSGGEDV